MMMWLKLAKESSEIYDGASSGRQGYLTTRPTQKNKITLLLISGQK
jgi:hypothetical protein